MRTSLHHVGVIVPTREQAQELIAFLRLREQRVQYVPEYQAQCIFAADASGRAQIELIVPTGGKLADFNKGMGGLHHLAFQVDDLHQCAKELQEEGVQLLEAKPVDAGPLWINFVPPLFTRGVITEFVQEK